VREERVDFGEEQMHRDDWGIFEPWSYTCRNQTCI